MRHRNRGRKLGRSGSHRKAVCRNILKELFQRGQIITTVAKAKACAPLADKVITIAKRAEQKARQMEKKLKTSARGEITAELETQMEKQRRAIRTACIRHVLAKIDDKKIVRKIFHQIAPLYAERSGGYTSVLHMNGVRLGDNGRRAVLKLVEFPTEDVDKQKEAEAKKAEKERRKKEKVEIKRKRRERKEREKEKEKARKEKAREEKEKEGD